MNELTLALERNIRLIKITGGLFAFSIFTGFALLGEGFLTWSLIGLVLFIVITLTFLNLYLSVATFLGIFLVIQQQLESITAIAKYGDEVIALLLFVMVIAKNQKTFGKFQWKKSPIDIYMIGFVVLSIISALLNKIPAEVTARGLYATLKGVLMFYIVWNLTLEVKIVDRFISFMEKFSTLLCLIAMIQYIGRLIGIGPAVVGWANLGITSIFVHRSNFAYFIAFFSSFTFARLITGGKTLRRYLIMIFGILIAISRATWLAIGTSLLFHSLRIRSRRILATSIIIVILLIVGITFVILNSDLVRANLAQKISGYTLAYQYYITKTNHSTRGVDYRMISLFEGLRVLKDHLLLGVGPGRYGGWVAYEYNSPIYETYNIPILGKALRQSDNYWIHLLAESGLLGFTLFFLSLFTIYKKFLHIYCRTLDKSLRCLSLGAMISFIFILIVGFFSPILEGSPMPYYFWAAAGAVLSLGHRFLSNEANTKN